MTDTTMALPLVERVTSLMPAEERLTESRRLLRNALLQIAHPPKALPGGGSAWRHKLAGAFRSIPGAAALIDVARQWWHQHPWRHTASVTGLASQSLIGPVVQRHPVPAMAAATAAGAALVLLKPWRLLKPKLLVGAASLLLSQSIKSGSAALWLQALLGLASRSKRLP
jgi:hypothetical protein